VLVLLLLLQAAAAMIGEQWRIDFFGRAAGNVRFTAIHPGGMLSDIARKSIPGMKGSFHQSACCMHGCVKCIQALFSPLHTFTKHEDEVLNCSLGGIVHIVGPLGVHNTGHDLLVADGSMLSQDVVLWSQYMHETSSLRFLQREMRFPD
jgi:hypothetical protein